MKNVVERMAKTVDEAIAEGLEELQISVEDAVIEVIDEGEAGGLLGFGRRPARVRISRAEQISEEKEAEWESSLFEEDKEEFERGSALAIPGAEDGRDDEETDARRESAAPSDAAKEAAEEAAVEFVATVLQSLGIHGRISSYYDDDSTLRIDVTGKDVGNAIGRRGETLDALQYLATQAINRGRDEYIRLSLDIGRYHERRIRTLRSDARRCAARVLRSGKRCVMNPMSSAERRQVHMALADFEGILTYSEGDEPNRSVVIAPNDKTDA